MLSDELIRAIRESGKPIALFDIDGVLLNNAARLPFIQTKGEDGNPVSRGPDADWQAWHDNYTLDTAGAFVTMFQAVRDSVFPILVTARIDLFEDSSARTHRMLQQFGVCVPDCALVMRVKGVDQCGFKHGVAVALQACQLPIAFAVDDGLDQCNEYLSLGIPTLRAWNHLPAGERRGRDTKPKLAGE